MKRMNIPAALLLLTVPALALAHPGHGVADNALLNGLLHPLTGTDHLLVLTGLGALAGMLDARRRLQALLALVAALFTGAIAGALIPSAAMLESLVTFSLLMLPVLLFSGRFGQAAHLLAIAAAVLFSVAHGAVQGSESGGVILTVMGLMTSSSLLLVAGFGLARVLMPRPLQTLPVRHD